MFGIGDQVICRDCHRSLERCGIAAEGNATVVRHIEPFVRVGRPGVGIPDTFDPMPQRWHRRCPQAERAINMHPGTRRPNGTADLANRIEYTRIDVAGLCTDDRRRKPCCVPLPAP